MHHTTPAEKEMRLPRNVQVNNRDNQWKKKKKNKKESVYMYTRTRGNTHAHESCQSTHAHSNGFTIKPTKDFEIAKQNEKKNGALVVL